METEQDFSISDCCFRADYRSSMVLCWCMVCSTVCRLRGRVTGLFYAQSLSYDIPKTGDHYRSRKIVLQTGVETPGETWEFDTQSTHVSVLEPEHSMDKIKIHLNDARVCVEVGEFLNQQDCTITRESLEEAGLIVCSNKWWLQS
jgi:hypothetical protein